MNGNPTPPTAVDHVRMAAKSAGKRASIAGQKGKLRAEILLMDNKINARKMKFGVELYDFLVPQAENDPTFIIDSEVLTNIRGMFVTAFKDNKALLQKKAKKQMDLTSVVEQRAVAFPVPAVSIGEKMVNAGRAASFTGRETAIKTKISLLEKEMKINKQNFGVQAYALLVNLEDTTKWLPSDRDVRFFYDQCRRDIQKMEEEKKEKQAGIQLLGLK